MNMLSYCQAMEAFCRQRARFEGEDEAFWVGEADEWNTLVSGYANMADHSVRKTIRAPRDWPSALEIGRGATPGTRPHLSGM